MSRGIELNYIPERLCFQATLYENNKISTIYIDMSPDKHKEAMIEAMDIFRRRNLFLKE